MSVILDLLGDPIPEGFGRRGRPPHIATDENRSKVRMLVAFDWEDARISKALRISAPTLRKHYFRELRERDEALPALEAAMIFTTFSEALKGNPTMMKEARKLLDRRELERLGITADRHGGKKKADKLGKKEQALADARVPDMTSSLGELMAQRQAGQKSN